MRKVILFIATSLDGFIASADGDTSWLFTDGDFGYKKFYESIDTTLMGYNTYFFIKNFSEFPFPDKTNFVFTRKIRSSDGNNVEFILGDIAEFVTQLKKQDGKNIYLIGGGQVNSVLLNANLIDQMIISVHPIALGQGIPLFKDKSLSTLKFELTQHEVFEKGLVQLTYTKS